MSDLLLVGLIVAVAVLWQRVEALSDRLRALEFGATGPVPEPIVIPEPVLPPVRAEAPVAPPPAYEPPPRPAPAPVEPDPEPVADAPAPPRIGFEELFGRRLPIWAGGVTLAVTGFLLVKYSIDAGLLSPAVRVALGLVFGVGLIGGAEVALRRDDLVRDPRIAQALGGAGVATLYGVVLAAANLYALIGPGVAFAGMAAVTVLAGALALRFGAPAALLGLVGGLAAPALVGAGEPNVPLLAVYLALTVGGLCTLGRSRGWLWLGAAALVGGFGWGLVLILGGALDWAASLSVGLFTLLLAVGLPLALFARDGGTVVRLAAALAGCAQMAALVGTGGFTTLNWALFGLLSAALVWLARREAALRPLAPVALAVALILAAAWPAPTPFALAAVLAGAAAIHAAPAAWELWRGRGDALDAGRVAAVALAVPALPLLHFAPAQATLGLLALLGAAPAAALAARGWGRSDDARSPVLAGGAAALLIAAGAAIAPDWLDAPGAALAAGGLLLLAPRAKDRRIEPLAWAFAAAVLGWLVADAGTDVERAFGVDRGLSAPRFATWAVPALVATLFAWRGRLTPAPAVAQVAAVLLAYAAAAQVTPAVALPIVPALLLAAASLRPGTLPARGAAAALAAGWAAEPLLVWTAGGLGALVGEPLLATAVPAPGDVVIRVALPALALLAAARDVERLPRPAALVAGALGLVAAHALYKQLFALASPADFVALGLTERTVWQAALALAALAALAAYRRARTAALALGAAGLAHFGWFTLVVHNPLWSDQAVGAWPVLNLLLPAYGVAALLLLAAGRVALPLGAERARQWAMMALLVLFALSAVRQAAAGPLLTRGVVGDAESIAYSLLGVALAIGFLRHGIVRGARDWRLASLLLMLAAVAKVFLVDAAGLDGLLRIISFAGLGVSLLGLGWLYSRFLPEPAR